MNPRKRGTSRCLTAFALVIAGMMPLSAQERPLLRTDISAFALSTADGSSRSVLDLAKDAPHAFLLLPASLPSADCKPLLTEAERVRSFGLQVTFVASSLDDSCAPPGTLRASKPFDALLRAAAISETACQAVVVDAGGIVRMHLRFEPSPTTVRAGASVLIAWEQGRQAFSVHCGHCHGDDGADKEYPGIKPLPGVSTRLPDGKILEGGEQSGSVAISTWTPRERESLLLFIRGL